MPKVSIVILGVHINALMLKNILYRGDCMLKEKRDKKGLTQLELARKIGKHKSYISKLESHPHICNPSVNTMLKLSKELDIHYIKVFRFFAENKEI